MPTSPAHYMLGITTLSGFIVVEDHSQIGIEMQLNRYIVEQEHMQRKQNRFPLF
jgi:hypothetical protein